MKLNCKPGDLAINVGGTPTADRFRGRIYLVLRAYDEEQYAHAGPGWWCEWNGEERHVRDACLRPIRGSDGKDETLTWKDVPAPATPTRAPTPQEVS